MSHLPEPTFSFLPRGATIQTFPVSDTNIVLSLPSTSAYAAHPGSYLGATIGRTSNRTHAATIPNLNGKSYELNPNNGPNSLHGGPTGWHTRTFTGPTPLVRNGRESVKFTYTSPDGEEGYPGTVVCNVYYTAYTEPSPNGPTKTILETEHEVTFPPPGECPRTVVAPTNHSYFNLSPEAPPGHSRTNAGTEITLGTPYTQEITPDGIPTGVISPHQAAPSDLSKPIILGEDEPFIDHCFVFPHTPEDIAAIPLDTRQLPMKMAVRLRHPVSGLNLEVHTTEPAFQIFTGDGLDVPEFVDKESGKQAGGYGRRSGIALEPSRFVDCVGREELRGMCEVGVGGVVAGRSRYVAWKERG